MLRVTVAIRESEHITQIKGRCTCLSKVVYEEVQGKREEGKNKR